jgi:hypothetical protein
VGLITRCSVTIADIRTSCPRDGIAGTIWHSNASATTGTPGRTPVNNRS